MNRGEVWRYELRLPDESRPVVVLSRQDVIELLHTVMVVPITSTQRHPRSG